MIPIDLPLVANHVWQSTLFAGAAWVLTLVLKKNRAAVPVASRLPGLPAKPASVVTAPAMIFRIVLFHVSAT